MSIHPAVVETARKAEPMTTTSAITGQIATVPFDFDQCIDFINTHIRADKKNQLLLRTALRPSDLQAIRDAAANRSTRSAQVIRTKMARDSLYQPVHISEDGTTTRIKLV
ncbi:hypothetical protein FB45DRAFT_1021873 [Roridomyces roridus]|uniref:DUF8205 domain-containing protein n=1 Tax=Roridomyces roridus TaxID=1738132 RepID=A0AAD7C758_9AGAR|nr:hypothetical protein FB45DRAFT_1021873 [Roridomyces roridus]